jgi:ADP-heptose:LPS heptosyltransferase
MAILRLRSLGDCVLTTPAVDILKRCRPDLRLAVVVENRFRDIFAGNPDIDEILAPEVSAVREFRPRLCLNLHGGTRSAWLTAASGARYRAGFQHFRHAFVYNIRIPRAQQVLGEERTVHTAEHLASAAFYLGAPKGEIPRAKLAAAGNRSPAAQSYGTIHPFGAAAGKCWSADGFLAVAGHLRGTGIEPVFIGAAGDDLSPFQAYRCLSGAPLQEIKELLSGSSLFVGNDSGPAHMAAAFGVPVVVIFGASDPAIWGPWRTTSEIVHSPVGIQRIEPAQVIDALARLRVAA